MLPPRSRPVHPPRRRALATALAAVAGALVLPGLAHAGTYAVSACGSDGVNRAFWAFANPGLSARSACPGVDYQGDTTGLVARAEPNAGGGRLGAGASAWNILEAPAGAVLQSMRFAYSAGRSSGCWSLGVFGWNGDAFHPGHHLFGSGADCSATPGGYSYFVGPYTIDLRGYQKVRLGVRCDGPTGCPTSHPVATWANFKDVVVTIRDDSPPAIVPGAGALWGDGWHRGVEDAWAGHFDNVGIRHIYGQVDGGAVFSWHDFNDAGWGAGVRCDFARPRPCQDIPHGAVYLNTASVADGAHTLRVASVDSAGNVAAVDRTIRIDNHAPAAPRGVAVAGGQDWRTANGFDVSWELPPDQVAPIVRAHWRLCRASAPAECQTGSREGRDIGGLEGLQVPGAGDWTLAVWLEDEAGNADARHAADPVHLRLDDVAPHTAGFDLQDPADPRRLSLAASDAHSGLAAARIELRPRGAAEWRALPTALGADGRATARVPDTELPDGTYDMQAVVRDAAGNETVADRDVTGRPMTLVLPLRLPTRLVARPAATRSCRTVRRRVAPRRTVSRRVCRRLPAKALGSPLRLAFGRSATMRGALQTWQGRPVAGAAVDVLERPRTGGRWTAAVAVRTDARGAFTLRVAPGPSRTLRLAYPGDNMLLPAVAEARVLVPAAGTLRVSRSRARNGGSVLFTGRLLGRSLPAGGRTVDLQAHYRGAWRTFATPRVDARGRWRHAYRFGATRGRVVYRFRGLIKRDASYPYEQGVTPSVRVVVTG